MGLYSVLFNSSDGSTRQETLGLPAVLCAVLAIVSFLDFRKAQCCSSYSTICSSSCHWC